MAGIGFELRRYLDDDSFSGTFRAYGFAGLVSAGPWVLSIVGVMLIGIIGLAFGAADLRIQQFTTSVTWLMGTSLILTGLLQLVFTRFVADRLFENREGIINANLGGALLLTTLSAIAVSALADVLLFDLDASLELLLAANFVVLSNIWMVVIFVAGIRRFNLIVWSFAVGYGTTVLLALLLSGFGLKGLLAGLMLGHCVLLFMMLSVVLTEYPINTALRAEFLKRSQIYPSLVFIGFFYNLGIWIDKLLFWLHPATSEAVLGPMRASYIYDLPIFLAYLSIIPGMAVFLLRIETDFAEAYDGFFSAVRGNASFGEIQKRGGQMVEAVREGLFQIVRVQGVTVLILYLAGPQIIAWLGLPAGYVHLYYIDLVGVAAQVLMLAVLNVQFYLDRLRDALLTVSALLISNTLLTWLTLELGPRFYGYGFGVAMLGSAVLGVVLLGRELDDIEYRTFMRVRAGNTAEASS